MPARAMTSSHFLPPTNHTQEHSRSNFNLRFQKEKEIRWCSQIAEKAFLMHDRFRGTSQRSIISLCYLAIESRPLSTHEHEISILRSTSPSECRY
jgi:hypothetical protein